MWPDGICRVTDTRYTKTIQYQDINYQLSQNEDKTAIFEAWCDFLNYFDSSVQFQLSFVNLSASQETFARSISIPPCGDEFDGIRAEYAGMLQNQLARGNNGLIKTKYLTFGVEADNLRAANPANRPSSSRTGNTNRFRIAFQRSGTRQGDCPTPKSNQVGVSSEHPLPAGSNKARKASFSIDNWELTTGNCSASLFSFFSLIANRSGNNLASLLSFPSIANCPLSIDNLFAASTKPTFSILLTKANTSPLSPQA